MYIFKLLSHFLIIFWLAACSRYAPLTKTTIKLSGIHALTADGSNATLNGISSAGDYFQKTFSGESVDDIELEQDSWTFYGFRVSRNGETLCGFTNADLVAEQQTVIVTYDKRTCSRSVFGNRDRFSEKESQLLPQKVFFCSDLPGEDATSCGEEAPFDGKSARLTYPDINLSTVEAPLIENEDGINSGCLAIKLSGELEIPNSFLTAPAGSEESLPTQSKISFYSDDNCKGDTHSIDISHFSTIPDNDSHQRTITSSNYIVIYRVGLFGPEDEEETEEPEGNKVAGASCEKNTNCLSELCGEIYSAGYEKAGGTPEYDEKKFELQCLAFNAGSECTDDSDCQSEKCTINTRGLGQCSKVSVVDEQPFCKSNTDCLSGYCYQWNEDNPRGGVCLAIPSTTNYFSFNAADEITLDLGTDSSMSGTSDFSVSLWFKATYPAPEDPMLLVTQRDSTYMSGIYSIGINGASPGFAGYIPSGNYKKAEPGSINFSLRSSGAAINNVVTPDTNILDSNWHHLVVTRSSTMTGTNIAIFLDKTRISNEDYASTINLDNRAHTYIGGNESGQREFFDGNINLFTTWNVALDQTTIETLFDLGQESSLVYETEIKSQDIESLIDFNYFESTLNSVSVNRPNDLSPFSDAYFTKSGHSSNTEPYIGVIYDGTVKMCEDYGCDGYDADYSCNTSDYICQGTGGAICSNNSDCVSGNCANNSCQKSSEGDFCISNSDCESNFCRYNITTYLYSCAPQILNELNLSRGIESGGSSAIVVAEYSIEEDDSSSYSIEIYQDDDCSTSAGDKDLSKDDDSSPITLTDLSEGENSLYYKITADEYYSSGCSPTGVSYTVLSETDLRQGIWMEEISVNPSMSSQYLTESVWNVFDGSAFTWAHTDINDVDPWMEFQFENEIPITYLKFTARSDQQIRFQDLDILMYDSRGEKVYQYSDETGYLYRQSSPGGDPLHDSMEFELDFLDGGQSMSGGLARPVMAKTIKLTRTSATVNPTYPPDNNILNISKFNANAWLLGNDFSYVPPIKAIEYDSVESTSSGIHTFNVEGYFNNHTVFLFTDEYCLDDYIGYAESAYGSSTNVTLDNFSPNDYPSGKITVYASIMDTQENYSECSNLSNLSESFDNEHENEYISSVSFTSPNNAGLSTARVAVSLADSTGYSVEIFNDSSCSFSLGGGEIESQEDISVTLYNLSSGNNDLYAVYTDADGEESDCIDLNQQYYVFQNADITAENQSGYSSIFSSQHSLWQGAYYPASDAIDGDETTFAHTSDTPTGSGHWLLYSFSERYLTKITVTSRGGYWGRFQDLDLELLDSSDNVVYRYSSITGSYFKEDTTNSTESWEVDLQSDNLSEGGVNVPILASKLKIIRYPKNSPPVTDTNADIYSINIAEVKIEGLESDASSFISPPYLMSLNKSSTAEHSNYVLDVSGNFSDTQVSVYSDENCNNLLGQDSSASGNNADVHLTSLDLSDLIDQELTFYVQEYNGSNLSECSSAHNINLDLDFGLTTERTCSSDIDCVEHHPQAVCFSSTCKLPPTASTSSSSWCISESSSNSLCSYSQNGDACSSDEHCSSNYCSPGTNTCATQSEQLIAVGKDFTCFAIDGSPKCFGKNSHGQLGNGNTDDNYTPSAVIDTSENELSDIIQLTAGDQHACALNSDGEVWCWGKGAKKLYADENSSDRNTGAVKISGISATKISTSNFLTCAVTSSGELKCWGKTSNMALSPFGGSGPYDTPTTIIATGIADVKTTKYNICFLYTTGEIKCIGGNSKGNAGKVMSDLTVSLPDITALINSSDETIYATDLDNGYKTGCLITEDETAFCWGGNAEGQLAANYIPNQSYKAIQVDIDDHITDAEVGDKFSCFLLKDKTVKCAGHNNKGQLGYGSVTSKEDPPVEVTGLSNITTLGVGFKHSCAFDGDSSLFCWGDNTSSNISNENTNEWSAPVEVYNHSEQGQSEINWDSTCSTTSDCLDIDDNTVCRVTNGERGGIGHCGYEPGVTTSDGSLCLSYHYSTSGSDYICKYSAPSNGGECQNNGHCITNNCNTSTYRCLQGSNSSSCYEDYDCHSLNCEAGACSYSSVGNGGSCSADAECITNLCNTSINACSQGGTGAGCIENVDCESNICGSENTCEEEGSEEEEEEEEEEFSSLIHGACPKLYSASQLSLDGIQDWNNITFSNTDGNLSYSVDVENKTMLLKFASLDQRHGGLSYSYSETIGTSTSSGYGSITFTNTTFDSTSPRIILVDNFSDSGGESHCTLRDAINSWADPGTSYGGCTQGLPAASKTVLQFAPSDEDSHTVSLSSTNLDEDSNLGGDLDLTCSSCGHLVIEGCGENKTILDGGNTDRVLDIQSVPSTSIYNLTIKNGKPSNGLGGGIHLYNTNLYLENVAINDNTAEGVSGTDSDIGGGGGGGPGLGGGIYSNASNITIGEGVSFSDNIAKGGLGGNATNFDSYTGNLMTCMNLSSCPNDRGGQGANTIGYSGGYNGGSPFINTPSGDYNGGHGGLSYYNSMGLESTPHSGTVGTFGGGGGGAGNSFDGTEIQGGDGSVRAGSGESSSGVEGTYLNGDGGAGGAFGGAIYLRASNLYFPIDESDMPTFSNNTIFLTALEENQTETENVFKYSTSSVFSGTWTPFSFTSEDGHTEYECTSSTGHDCECQSGTCSND